MSDFVTWVSGLFGTTLASVDGTAIPLGYVMAAALITWVAISLFERSRPSGSS